MGQNVSFNWEGPKHLCTVYVVIHPSIPQNLYGVLDLTYICVHRMMQKSPFAALFDDISIIIVPWSVMPGHVFLSLGMVSLWCLQPSAINALKYSSAVVWGEGGGWLERCRNKGVYCGTAVTPVLEKFNIHNVRLRYYQEIIPYDSCFVILLFLNQLHRNGIVLPEIYQYM